MINNILDFFKIKADKLELENQPFNLRECIEGALDLLAVKSAEKALDLAYFIEKPTPEAIFGDSTRLRQILINLLNNGLKLTGPQRTHCAAESPASCRLGSQSDADRDA